MTTEGAWGVWALIAGAVSVPLLTNLMFASLEHSVEGKRANKRATKKLAIAWLVWCGPVAIQAYVRVMLS